MDDTADWPVRYSLVVVGLSFLAIPVGAAGCGNSDRGSGSSWTSNSPFVQVSLGTLNGCALRNSGSVECWGYGYTEGAEGSEDESTESKLFGGSLEWLAEGGQGCGLRPSGELVCWGAPFVEGEKTTKVEAVAVSGDVCVLRDGGAIHCWVREFVRGQPIPEWRGTGDRRFRDLSIGGYSRLCTIAESGRLECWGVDEDEAAENERFDETRVEECPGGDEDCRMFSPASGKFTDVSVARDYGCAVRESGEVECWVFDSGFQRNDNDYGQTEPPDGSFEQISAGTFHVCGVKTGRAIDCWGLGMDPARREDSERRGRGDFDQAAPPSGEFEQVSVGDYHTCAVTDDGWIECWGLGTDPDRQEHTPELHGGSTLDYDQAAPPER